MAEEVAHHLGNDVVGAGKAYPPAGHGIGLRHAVDEDGQILDLVA